ncbi:MAG: RNA polymerase sigma factor [Luteolibacter sp.]
MSEAETIPPQILDGVRKGDEDAWRELIRLLSPQVYSIIRRQIRSNADHDDLAQDTFTKIFLKLDRYAGKNEFRHWVSRITINTCYDWLRKRKIRPLSSFSDLGEKEERLIGQTLAGEGQEDGENLDELRHILDSLIASLKPREQVVIRLLDLEENSVQTVCELTGWGESKVKVTALRARRKLADMLGKIRTGDNGHG